jgi:uncharacterized protein (TIGR00725 family)
MDRVSASERPLIAVIGGSVCSQEEYAMAEQVGRLIAQNGAMLVCGGMSGVMEAACKGAVNAGGLTIGILPSDSVDDSNPFVTIPIATGMGIGRNILIVRTGNVIIAIDGEYGTLSEISYAMQLNKPVIALRPWIMVPGIHQVETPEEAVAVALKNLKN